MKILDRIIFLATEPSPDCIWGDISNLGKITLKTFINGLWKNLTNLIDIDTVIKSYLDELATITINAGQHCVYSIASKVAYKDKIVKFTAIASEGYEISSVTALDSLGNSIVVTEELSGVYSFTMPSKDVTVTITAQLPVLVDNEPSADSEDSNDD